MVAASAQNKKKKGQKRNRTPKAAMFGLDVYVNSHVAATTIVLIFITKAFFFFYFFFFVKTFIHVYAQLLTSVVYATFDSTNICIYIYSLHLIYLVFRMGMHTRASQKKRFIMLASVQKRN